MDTNKKTSISVIRRLPKYYRCLGELLGSGVERVSSRELSQRMFVTDSQIRQDLNCFGGFGVQGYGYNVKTLHKEVGNILGINRRFKMIIIGAGNVGKALANYPNFAGKGFDIIGLFDVDDRIVGTKIGELTVRKEDSLERFLRSYKVDIAAICVPNENAEEVARKLTSQNVHGIWNFSSVDFKVPEEVAIENVYLVDSLMVLGYQICEQRKKAE